MISSVIHPDIINKYFCSISSDPEYIAPAPIDIPNGARIPKIPLKVVTSFLSRLKRTASGPDELPYWLFRDFTYVFDSVSHNILCSKLKQVNINPYIINWLISFLDPRKQRVVEYVSINSGVPQATVLGLVLFSIFINNIKAVNTDKNLLVKFGDDIIVTLPIESQSDENMGTSFTR